MDSDLITLVVPTGAEAFPISHGSRNYIPRREDTRNPMSRWLVDVPRVAAQAFTANGGFSMYEPTADTPAAPPRGFALLRHPDPKATTSLGTPDGEGNHIVPVTAVVALRAHGFIPVDGMPEPEDLPDDETRVAAIGAVVELRGQLGDAEHRLEVAGQMVEDANAENDELRKRIADLEAAAAAKPADKPADTVAATDGKPADATGEAGADATEKPAAPPAPPAREPDPAMHPEADPALLPAKR